MIKSLKVVILQLCYFTCVEIKMLELIAMNLSGTLSIIIWLSEFFLCPAEEIQVNQKVLLLRLNLCLV